jgi:tRNA pseudouridine38-40 synthase
LSKTSQKIKLDLSFAGTNFRGFQSQRKGHTVQDALEAALGKIGFSPKLTGCSRTDGGVHARNYVAHFQDVKPERSCRDVLRGLRSNLPEDILVKSASRVDGEFHARYSCVEKTYRYYLFLGDAVPPPAAPYVARIFPALSVEAMCEILPVFLRERDFKAFTTSEGRKSNTVREINAISLFVSEPLLCVEIKGRSFLHRMVRFMAGALLACSRGKVSKDFLENALSGNEDFLPFPALAAHGLHLWDVKYEAPIVSEEYKDACPVKLWPFEDISFREAGRAPL